MIEKNNLTYKKIFLFWIPLLSTWLMMGLEGPFIAAIIARLGDAKFNLAAYGIAYSFAIIIESPVIMLLSAANKLTKNKQNYFAIRKFTLLLNAMVTLIFVIFIIKPVYYFFASTLMDLPSEIVGLSYNGLIILLPWPAAIGYRRLYQGLLIKNAKTRYVAYGTITRLVSMVFTAIVLFLIGNINGVVVGAAALSIGVIAEAVACRLMAKKIVSKIKNGELETDENILTFREIVNFYYPLALTSILSLAVHPMIAFFLGHSKNAIESLAVMPVINSLVFLFRTFGLSYQDVGVTLLDDKFSEYKIIKNFAIILSVISTLFLFSIAFTPLSMLWFNNLSGLGMELSKFAEFPLQILAIMPALAVLLNFQRSIMMASKRTFPLSIATGLEVLGIFISLFIFVHIYHLNGALSAALAILSGRILSVIYLHFPFRKEVIQRTNLL